MKNIMANKHLAAVTSPGQGVSQAGSFRSFSKHEVHKLEGTLSGPSRQHPLFWTLLFNKQAISPQERAL